MDKQIDIIAEMKDIEIFFKYLNGKVSKYLENCYRVTFPNESDITYGNMATWNCNGFKLVGFGVNDNKELTVIINVNDRRIMQKTVKQELVIQ